MNYHICSESRKRVSFNWLWSLGWDSVLLPKSHLCMVVSLSALGRSFITDVPTIVLIPFLLWDSPLSLSLSLSTHPLPCSVSPPSAAHRCREALPGGERPDVVQRGGQGTAAERGRLRHGQPQDGDLQQVEEEQPHAGRWRRRWRHGGRGGEGWAEEAADAQPAFRQWAEEGAQSSHRGHLAHHTHVTEHAKSGRWARWNTMESQMHKLHTRSLGHCNNFSHMPLECSHCQKRMQQIFQMLNSKAGWSYYQHCPHYFLSK